MKFQVTRWFRSSVGTWSPQREMQELVMADKVELKDNCYVFTIDDEITHIIPQHTMITVKKVVE